MTLNPAGVDDSAADAGVHNLSPLGASSLAYLPRGRDLYLWLALPHCMTGGQGWESP